MGTLCGEPTEEPRCFLHFLLLGVEMGKTRGTNRKTSMFPPEKKMNPEKTQKNAFWRGTPTPTFGFCLKAQRGPLWGAPSPSGQGLEETRSTLHDVARVELLMAKVRVEARGVKVKGSLHSSWQVFVKCFFWLGVSCFFQIQWVLSKSKGFQIQFQWEVFLASVCSVFGSVHF